MAHIPGVPSTETRDNAAVVRLINGTEIQVAGEILTVAESQDIEYLAPVAMDADDNVIVAVSGEPAIGIAMAPVATDAGETKTVHVLRAGVLNPEALAWDASYDTAAKRASAFRGAPAPTNIIVKASV